MNADIENAVKQCFTCLEYQNMQLEVRTTPYEVPAKAWEVVGTGIFMMNNKNCCAL